MTLARRTLSYGSESRTILRLRSAVMCFMRRSEEHTLSAVGYPSFDQKRSE
jgi:hypothetical protein